MYLTTNVFNESFITRNLTGIYNTVYFRLCIDLMRILPPITAKGFDGSHHPGVPNAWGPDTPMCIVIHGGQFTG